MHSLRCRRCRQKRLICRLDETSLQGIGLRQDLERHHWYRAGSVVQAGKMGSFPGVSQTTTDAGEVSRTVRRQYPDCFQMTSSNGVGSTAHLETRRRGRDR